MYSCKRMLIRYIRVRFRTNADNTFDIFFAQVGVGDKCRERCRNVRIARGRETGSIEKLRRLLPQADGGRPAATSGGNEVNIIK